MPEGGATKLNENRPGNTAYCSRLQVAMAWKISNPYKTLEVRSDILSSKMAGFHVGKMICLDKFPMEPAKFRAELLVSFWCLKLRILVSSLDTEKNQSRLNLLS